MANTMELYKVYSFTTSPDLCQCTNLWNTDVPNCYITQWLLYRIAYFCIINSTEGAT